MPADFGERHAQLLDQAINIIGLFPPDYITGLDSSYFGDGGGMLVLEQSPHLQDPHSARLSILGAIAGSGVYGDESRLSFALSNNVNLPNGTHVQLRETLSRPTVTIPDRIPDNAIEAFADISNFIRIVEGNIWTASLISTTASQSGIEANVRGVFDSDEMQAAYIASIEAAVIVDEQETPTTAGAVRSIQHKILTPSLGQLVTFSMSDHRPGSREAMLKLRV